MSTSFPSNATPVNIFQTHFGTAPGTQDPKAECEQWQQLCGVLLAERERLRTELENARLKSIITEWNQEPIRTKEEVYATVVKDQTFEEFIAELKKESEIADE